MSDTVQTGPRSKPFAESRAIESRLMFGACYLLFLFRAVTARLMPRRRQAAPGRAAIRESVFREASSAASVLVTSSFMGL